MAPWNGKLLFSQAAECDGLNEGDLTLKLHWAQKNLKNNIKSLLRETQSWSFFCYYRRNSLIDHYSHTPWFQYCGVKRTGASQDKFCLLAILMFRGTWIWNPFGLSWSVSHVLPLLKKHFWPVGLWTQTELTPLAFWVPWFADGRLWA